MEIIFFLALGLYSVPMYTVDMHNNMLYEENYQKWNDTRLLQKWGFGDSFRADLVGRKLEGIYGEKFLCYSIFE
jgi:hypothetical protein